MRHLAQISAARQATFLLSQQMRSAIQDSIAMNREMERAHQKKLEDNYASSAGISEKIAIGSLFPMILGGILEMKGLKGAFSTANNYAQLPSTLGKPFQDSIEGKKSLNQSLLQHDRLEDQSMREDQNTANRIDEANKSAISQLIALLPQSLRG